MTAIVGFIEDRGLETVPAKRLFLLNDCPIEGRLPPFGPLLRVDHAESRAWLPDNDLPRVDRRRAFAFHQQNFSNVRGQVNADDDLWPYF